MKTYRFAIAAAAAAVLHLAAAQDITRLGKDLTPSGAEAGANKEGSIPRWNGHESAETGWTYGKSRGDAWKYKGEKPLFSIDATNVDKHAQKLTPGQIAAIRQIKGYRMDVYPSHRGCGIPDFVAENTRKNVGVAKLGADGWSLKEAVVPGYPFTFPANGAEVMWNAKMRYRGLGVDYPKLIFALSPRRGSTEWYRSIVEQTVFYPWGAKGSNFLSKLPQVESYAYFAFVAPAAQAGQAISVSVFLDQPGNEVFYYFPGQRRVRRMPSYAYDAPQIGTENQYTMDEAWLFNGSMDRFDWKIVGKKEIYIPYNSFGMYDFTANIEEVAREDSINPANRRYELHRIWVVEASLKQGVRHNAPKRSFYFDEDSWNLVMAEDHDAQGRLVKYREGYLIPVYETGTCDVSALVQYNLGEGRYLFDGHPIGGGKDIRWVVESDGPRFKSGFYTAENLRAISSR